MTIFKTGMEGFYTITVNKPDGTEQVYSFKNKITSDGLQHFAKGAGNVIERIFLFQKKSGYNLAFNTASLAAASNHRYAHATFVSQTSATVSKTTANPYYKWNTVVKFDPAIITQPVDHIAVVFGTDTMFSHTPIKDNAGLPTQLIIGPQDTITVGYELRLFINTSPASIANVDMGQFGITNVTIRPCNMSDTAPNPSLLKMGFKFRPTSLTTTGNSGVTKFSFYNGSVATLIPNHYTAISNTAMVASTDRPYDFSNKKINTVVAQDTGSTIGYMTTLSIVIAKDIVPIIEKGYHGVKIETTIGDYYIDFGKLIERNQRIRYDLTLNVGFLIGANK